MNKVIVGFDNGVTGTIGVINGLNGNQFIKTPVVKMQDYTKAKKIISRIDVPVLTKFIQDQYIDKDNIICIIERPMINPKRFVATMSAVRALEATLTILESLGLAYIFCDSKKWVKEVLPSGYSGTAELKKASMDIGIRLFPQFKELMLKHKDADGLLIAEYGRRKYG